MTCFGRPVAHRLFGLRTWSAMVLALCVFAAGLNDGNRAYAAVLGGYTGAIVAVANIDAPQLTF